MSIDNQYNDIPKDSDIKLLTRGLGSSFIEITSPIPDEDTEPLVHGVTIQGSTGISSDFFPEETQLKLEALVDDLRTFVGNANDIAGDSENKENLKVFLANLTEASDQAAKALEETRDTLKQAHAAIEDYRVLAGTGTEALDKVSASVSEASEEFAKACSQLTVLLSGINEGTGTAGKFVTDARLYEELLTTSQQLEIVAADLKALIKAINERGLMRVLKKGTQ